ncbi:uncharacterized protein LOC110276938 [Arachis duranensis]|uniref:Uncharacterized protein LOC110276938 n=1 Tax=Arachis duranensis TaxID=130453 RepID=A0A6P5N3N6_ARADU|nr:uncharacterized protein LOC110276938 [Arachis duranensis]
MVKGITNYQEKKKKKAINGCLFALMIIYFHLSKNKGKNRAERPPKSWIANWTKEQLVERMNAEREEILVRDCEVGRDKRKNEKKRKKRKKRKASPTSSSETETTDSDTSTSESEAQEDSENSGRKHPGKKGKKSEESSPGKKEKKKKKTKTTPKNERYEISSDELDEWLGENVHKSATEGDNQADLRSTEGCYVYSETLPAVNLGSDDPSSQGRTEQSSINQPSQSM